MKKNSSITVLLITFLLMVGCSNNKDTLTKANEELEYDVLVPSYLPSGLKLEEEILEGDLFLLTYVNSDKSAFIEITQRQNVRGLNTESLIEFTKDGEDPYEAIPHLSYLEVGNFVGEYRVNANSDNLSYQFIPSIPRTEINSYPFYWINSVGIGEDEFQKVVKSLE
jgi:hypothetical protein